MGSVSTERIGDSEKKKMAGDGGFEPPLPDPETGVLPLD
jgi:hypothetical protein